MSTSVKKTTGNLPGPGPGRPKGVPNKVTIKRAAEIAASGLTPLDYMLSILRDEKQSQEDRFAAAEKAAPYCHAKLAAMTLSGDENAPLKHVFEWLNPA